MTGEVDKDSVPAEERKEDYTRPEWLDKDEYPFASHFFRTSAGLLHYLDVGGASPERAKGSTVETGPIVFVHGNPSWSFEFRNLIKRMSRYRRCIAPDHLGFGLSEKPNDFSYLPVDHAKNIEILLESLNLDGITLVVEDWGGPIGLSYAIAHPEKVRALVISNTWLWSVRSSPYYQAFSKFTGGPFGRFLIKTRNFFARDILKAVFGNKKKLTPELHAHYLRPLEVPEERKGSWTFPREIVGSSEWLSTLWENSPVLKEKKILLAWGMKDIAFREKELNHWIEVFPEAAVVRFPDAGHYLAEEKPAELAYEIERAGL